MKCLVVDDSKLSRMMMKKIIVNNYSDWEVKEAANGQEAIDIAKGVELDIIFLDYNMPIMDGGQAAEVLRPQFPNASIAFLTANIQDSIQKMAEDLRIDFIPKPITEKKVLQYVERKSYVE